MFEAAQITAPISPAGLPQRSIACFAAATAISASTEISSLDRSGMFGRITSGSTRPVLSTT